MFLQNAETLNFGDSSIDFILFTFPKHLLSASFFHLFSAPFVEALLDRLFGDFFPIFSNHFGPTWRPTWAPNRPLGRLFRSKNRVFRFAANDPERQDFGFQLLSADLVPRSRQKWPQAPPDLHFYPPHPAGVPSVIG